MRKSIRHLRALEATAGSSRRPLLLLSALLCAAGMAAAPVLVSAQEVYRSVDENGIVTFSDVASENAELLELPPTVVREDALSRQQAVIEQQLEVARVLEESRLAREAARTERLEALAAARPQTVYYREADRDRNVYGGWGYWSGGYWPGHRPGHPGKPTHPVAPPAEPGPPPSRRVPLLPLKGD